MSSLDKNMREESLAFLKKNKIPSMKQALNISVQPNIEIDELILRKKFKGFNHTILGKGFEIIASKEFILSEINDFKKPDDWFFHLNQFTSSSILFLRIAKSLLEPITLEIDFTTLPASGTIYVLAEENVQATIIVKKTSKSKQENYLGLNINVLAKKNSNIDIVQLQEYSKNTNAFEKKTAKIEKDANVSWNEIIRGGAFVKSDTTSYLSGDNSKSKITSCYASKDQEKIDLITSAIHDAKNTTSNIITRGLSSGSSKALSQGLIMINKNAFGSSGFEKQDALILSETAQADAIPNLEILNNDVTCSHSSSVGQLDEEKLFYLTSRGMNESEAKNLIIRGYFSNLIDLVPNLARLEFEEQIFKAVDDLF